MLIVWIFKSGATGKLLGIAISNSIIAITLWFSMSREGTTRFSVSEVKRGLKEMMPLTLASFLHSTAPSADVIILERLNNLSGLGVYNVGKQVATFVITACTSVFQAFEPKFYEDFRNEPIRKSKNFRFFILTILIVVALYFIFSDLIIQVLTLGKFNDSLEYSNILVIQAMVLPVIQAIQVKFYILRKVKLIALINLFSSLVLLGLVLF
ncbi:MAG: oligosaccharide flippase family protein [Ignavibacteriales bacterium]|nr:oligosaccharide flippase family protein [Ignavibacteriales bacterium]